MQFIGFCMKQMSGFCMKQMSGFCHEADERILP